MSRSATIDSAASGRQRATSSRCSASVAWISPCRRSRSASAQRTGVRVHRLPPVGDVGDLPRHEVPGLEVRPEPLDDRDRDDARAAGPHEDGLARVDRRGAHRGGRRAEVARRRQDGRGTSRGPARARRGASASGCVGDVVAHGVVGPARSARCAARRRPGRRSSRGPRPAPSPPSHRASSTERGSSRAIVHRTKVGRRRTVTDAPQATDRPVATPGGLAAG